jgi:hypothetical protein
MADKLELNAQTGETIERDYTADEQTQREKDLAKYAAIDKAIADRAKLKEATLAKLGLTADEIAALLS